MKNFKSRGSNHDNRKRYVFYPGERGQMVKLSIHHRDGGRNYFSGQTEARGIEISISTVELASSGFGNVMMETSTPMSDENGRVFIMEMPRYSAKKLESAVAVFDEHAPEISATWAVDRRKAFEMITSIVQSMDVRKAA